MPGAPIGAPGFFMGIPQKKPPNAVICKVNDRNGLTI